MKTSLFLIDHDDDDDDDDDDDEEEEEEEEEENERGGGGKKKAMGTMTFGHANHQEARGHIIIVMSQITWEIERQTL